MWYYFVLAGLIGGIVGGMGMGGGTLLIPILTIFLGLGQHLSQGLNLIVFIPTAIFAIIIHAKNKLIDYRLFFYIVVPAICSSILFSYFANSLKDVNLKTFYAVFLIVVGVIMFSLSIKNSKKSFTKRLGI